MDNDIVIGQEWLDVDNTTKELQDLSAEWNNVIHMAEESVNTFKENGDVIGLFESLNMLLEYNKKARDFESKINTMNELQGGDVQWQ